MRGRARLEKIMASRSHPVVIRTARPADINDLTDYFGALSQASRINRFMGAVDNVARIARDCLMQGSRADRFTLLVERQGQGHEVIIGETSYAFDRDKGCGEFAISVADRWQRQGLGSALLCALQFRAISLGYIELFGETLKTNAPMTSLARKAGFAFAPSSDWRAIRFDKKLVGLGAYPQPGPGRDRRPEPGVRSADRLLVTP
jgi:L-amino acid N-acyltransferase YncA